MRKIKSLIALTLSFGIWQLIRIFLPMLYIHPIFAYVYSVIEIRETVEKTKQFGKLRIRATIVGLLVGLAFITVSVFLKSKIEADIWRALAEFIVVLCATLFSLVVAENIKCENFCGIAAIITIICMVGNRDESAYFYAIMRVVQTLLGVFSATFINVLIKRKPKA